MVRHNGAMQQHLTIITGASRGLGFAMAHQCAIDGHFVLGISRQRNDALLSPLPDSVQQWQCDLAQANLPAGRLVEWLGAQPSSKWASVNLINNAGVLALPAPASEVDWASLSNALKVGLEAPMLLTSGFLKVTANWHGVRRVLNISSGLGRRAMASQGAYCAAKAGLDHFTRCVALEEALKPNGAKVCSLAPGVIDTDMQAQLRGGDDRLFPDRKNFEALQVNRQLMSPSDTARRVLDYLHSAAFGTAAVADIRDI